MAGDNAKTSWWGVLLLLPIGGLIAYWLANDDAAEDVDSTISNVALNLGEVGGTFSAPVDSSAEPTDWNFDDEDDEDDSELGSTGDGSNLTAELRRELLRNVAVLRSLPPDVQRSTLASDPVVRRLVRRAQRLVADPDQKLEEVITSKIDTSILSRAEQEAIAQHAKAQIASIGLDFENAALEQSLTKLTNADVSLGLIRKDVADSLGGSAELPSDPLALAPTENLKAARDGLKTAERGIRTKLAVLGDTERYDGVLDLIESLTSRLDNVIGSAEHTSFHATKGEVLTKVSKTQWEKQNGTFESRRASAVQTALGTLESKTGFAELRSVVGTPRGPPNSVDVLFSKMVREFDTSPTEWAKSQAMLLSLGEELLRHPTVREAGSDHFAEPLKRVVTLLDTATLEHAKSITTAVQSSAGGLPEELIFPGRADHFETIRAAVDGEIKRRQSGAQRIEVGPDSELSRAVARHSNLDSMPRRAQVRMVGLVAERFPSEATIPLALRKEVRVVQQNTLALYADRMADLIRKYKQTSRNLALATDAAPEYLATQKKIRSKMAYATNEFAVLIDAAKKYGVESASANKLREKAVALFTGQSGEPPPFDPSGGGVPKAPTDLPGGGSGGARIHVFQEDFLRVARVEARTGHSPVFERHYYQTFAALESADAQSSELLRTVSKLDQSPIEYAKTRGRRTYDPETIVRLAGGTPDWLSMKPDTQQTRLKEIHHDWEGRRKRAKPPEGAPPGQVGRDLGPYDFRTEVKRPRTFKAVGGGIHFGETAEGKLVGLSALRYEDGNLFFSSKTGQRFPVRAATGIDPTSVKALYRFASADHGKRNAAVSIGWGTQRRSFIEQLTERESGSSILLDPLFVDTAVGQTLVLADSIPWRFGEGELPNGKKISFGKSFERAYEAFRQERRKLLAPVFEKTKPFSADQKEVWSQRLDGVDVPLIIQITLRGLTSDEAEDFYITRTVRDLVRKEGIAATDETALKGLKTLVEAKALEGSGISDVGELPESAKGRFSKLVDAEATRIKKAVTTDFDTRIKPQMELATEDSPYTIVDLVTLAAIQQGRCPIALAQLWGSLLMQKAQKQGQEISSSDLADGLLARLSTTTLAMLYDDSVSVAMSNEAVSIVVDMKYRYATTYLRVEDNEVVVGQESDPDGEVQTIEQLTSIANENLAEVAKLYGPVEEVTKHAALAALFRWANELEDAGELDIDLSDLAAAPAHDGERYPTPDEIKK